MKTENFSPRQALNKAFLRVKPNPTMVDIRDSGQIEEGADLILMLCGDNIIKIPLIRGLCQLSRIYNSPLKAFSLSCFTSLILPCRLSR